MIYIPIVLSLIVLILTVKAINELRSLRLKTDFIYISKIRFNVKKFLLYLFLIVSTSIIIYLPLHFYLIIKGLESSCNELTQEALNYTAFIGFLLFYLNHRN